MCIMSALKKKQTQLSIHNVPEHITSDVWTEAKGVNLLEEWTGTTRFQILRTTVPEGYGWVGQWKTHENPNDCQTRLDTA